MKILIMVEIQMKYHSYITWHSFRWSKSMFTHMSGIWISMRYTVHSCLFPICNIRYIPVSNLQYNTSCYAKPNWYYSLKTRYGKVQSLKNLAHSISSEVCSSLIRKTWLVRREGKYSLKSWLKEASAYTSDFNGINWLPSSTAELQINAHFMHDVHWQLHNSSQNFEDSDVVDIYTITYLRWIFKAEVKWSLSRILIQVVELQALNLNL